MLEETLMADVKKIIEEAKKDKNIEKGFWWN